MIQGSNTIDLLREDLTCHLSTCQCPKGKGTENWTTNFKYKTCICYVEPKPVTPTSFEFSGFAFKKLIVTNVTVFHWILLKEE